jgi:hypothetical protein
MMIVATLLVPTSDRPSVHAMSAAVARVCLS